MTAPTATPLPACLPGHPVGFAAIRQACADAGVRLADRYGYAIPDEHLVEVARIARRAKTLTAAGEALECAVLMGEVEISSPTSWSFPIGPADAHALAEVLRSPVADLAVLPALTIRQPWAGCITVGVKPVENRTWPTKYRGPLAIHAGAAFDRNPEWDALGLAHLDRFVVTAYYEVPAVWRARSAILAVVELTGCHEYTPGCCGTPWAEAGAGVWHWELADVRALAEPVACTGRLGLWRPSVEALALVAEQCEVAA